MYKNILIPTDGSDLSEKVVKDAVALAKALNARVTGVHVTTPVYILPSDDIVANQGKLYKDIERAHREAGRRYLARIEVAVKAAGVAFEGVVVEDKPAWEGIVSVAQAQHCDLIMMSAHGRGGVAALVLGSVTLKVLTHSKIPVLVYR